MMELSKGQEVAALFDLDGVVFDTESQYSLFWGMKGKTYHPEVEHFENVIKGQTLVQIFDRWFAGCDDVQRKIAGELEDFERNMAYDYVPGVEDFLRDLRRAGIRTAVVTSSNDDKMHERVPGASGFQVIFRPYSDGGIFLPFQTGTGLLSVGSRSVRSSGDALRRV